MSSMMRMAGERVRSSRMAAKSSGAVRLTVEKRAERRCHLLRDVVEGAEGAWGKERLTRPPQNARVSRRVGDEALDEGGLADAGLAADERDPPRACGGLVKQGMKGRQLVIAFEQVRRHIIALPMRRRSIAHAGARHRTISVFYRTAVTLFTAAQYAMPQARSNQSAMSRAGARPRGLGTGVTSVPCPQHPEAPLLRQPVRRRPGMALAVNRAQVGVCWIAQIQPSIRCPQPLVIAQPIGAVVTGQLEGVLRIVVGDAHAVPARTCR